MIDLTGSYCGAAPLPDALLARWNLDPLLLLALAAAALVAARLPAERRAAGLGAVALAAVLFVSPLCAASVALFSARTVHHLVLIGVIAPLAAIAWPAARPVSAPATLAVATIVLWLWHVPFVYDAALGDKAVYWAMQASLLASGWAYWSSVRAAPAPLALATVAAGAAQMGMLGAILTFAPRPLYEVHLATTVPFGLGPVADQQLAGLVMWVPGLLPYAIAAGLRLRGDWRRLPAR